MIRIFLLILLIVVSNKAIATIQGKTLICNTDTRGYYFISKDKVEVSYINFNELNVITIIHTYTLAENVIFINQPLRELSKNKKTQPIGWIFRRTLDYVSLNYKNGDWSRKFLWSCEVISSEQLETRLKNKLNNF